MRLIIISLLLTSIMGCSATSIFNCTKMPVLMYHDINYNIKDRYGVTPEQFSQHMKWLSDNGYNVITFDTLATANDNSVIITFDDGYRLFVDYAEPVLTKYNYPAVINIVGEWVGTIIPDVADAPALTWNDIIRLNEGGLIQFGSHTWNLHTFTRNVLTLSNNEILSDFKMLQEVFQTKTGSTLTILAYPYGLTTYEINMKARSAGYKYLQTSRPGLFNSCGKVVPRLTVTRNTTIESIMSNKQ